MWFILIIIFLVWLYYHVGIKPYKYWKEKSVPYIKPLPVLGNLKETIFKQKSLDEMIETFYYSYPEGRYVGLYQLLKPAFLVRDPELIKRITVKEFDTFPDHRTLMPADVDPLWNKNLFSLTSERGWHDMRATLSPSFTSSKMKMMFSLMKDCAKQFVDYLEKQGDISDIEMKDAFCRYTNDVIASAAFGITCNSLQNQNNDFYVMGKDAATFDGVRAIKVFAYSLSPVLLKFLGVQMFPKKVSNFFSRIIKETLQVRRQKGIIRPDMIHLLTEAQKGCLNDDDVNDVPDSGFSVVHESKSVLNSNSKKRNVEITDEDITAQALLFFIAGFDTSSTFMSFTAYELALNPDIQQRLYKEIIQYYNKCNGNITYEALLGMKYLDMVVTESLRKWPPVAATDRMSVKPFTIEPELPGEKLITLDQGTNIWIPVYPIHRDPKYYPNPENFDPERFRDENKHNIQQFTYMPFGVGPRNCIGSRFALLEGKLVLSELLLKFEIVPISKTQIPLKLKKGSAFATTEEGIWLGLKLRNK